MKQLFNTITFFLLVGSLTSSAQSKQDFLAGTTLSKMKNLEAGMGYYAGISTRGKLTDHIGYLGSMQISYFQVNPGDLTQKFYGLEPSFFFTAYPTKKSLSFLIGFTSTFLFDAKLGDVDMDLTKNTAVYFTPGVSYEITDRFGILGRYNVPLESTRYFEWTAQIGVTVKL